MMRRKVTHLLGLAVMAACVLQFAVSAEGADRRRGVSVPDEIGGIVIAMSPYELVLRNAGGDHNLRITTRTRVEGEVGVATQVQARYVKNEGGEKIAVSVEARREVIELRGVIQELLADRLVLLTGRGEVTVRVDERTIVVVSGVVATFADLAIGDRVEIEALPGGDQTLLALLIVAELDDIELHGVITALTESSLTIACLCREVEVLLTPQTIVRIYGREATIADLRVGMHAEIEANRADDGSLVALVVEIERGYDLDEVNGIVVAVSDTKLTVIARHGATFEFAIVPDTIILRRGEQITAADIEPGNLVEVKAVDDVSLGLVAVRIKVEELDMGFRELEGIIASVEGSIVTITLNDESTVSVLVDSRTIIRVDRQMGTVADLQPGRKVEVHVWRNPDGSMTAIAIKVEVEDADDSDFEIKGLVSGLTDGSITILTLRSGELTFLVDESTVVTRGDASIRFADVRVGDIVEIAATSDATGVLTALSIDVWSMPGGNEIEIDGEVTAVSSSSLALRTLRGDVTFAVTAVTVVLIDGVPATIADVVVGDLAEVTAQMRKGTWEALRIEVER